MKTTLRMVRAIEFRVFVRMCACSLGSVHLCVQVGLCVCVCVCVFGPISRVF